MRRVTSKGLSTWASWDTGGQGSLVLRLQAYTMRPVARTGVGASSPGRPRFEGKHPPGGERTQTKQNGE